jgi:RNAse (barnase) inhibitor barstar
MSALFYIIKDTEKFQSIRFKNTFIANLDGKLCQTSMELYSALETIFELPDYFGRNLDALYDCMMDLEWITKDNVILVIENFDFLLSKEENDPDFLDDFFITLDDICKSWDQYESEEITAKTMKVYLHDSQKVTDTLELNEIEYKII